MGPDLRGPGISTGITAGLAGRESTVLCRPVTCCTILGAAVHSQSAVPYSKADVRCLAHGVVNLLWRNGGAQAAGGGAGTHVPCRSLSWPPKVV